MRNDIAISAVTNTAAAEVSAPQEMLRRGREGPQPISGKRALLHARRLRQREAHIAAQPSADGELALRLRTEDGGVAFVLRPAAAGLVVGKLLLYDLLYSACHMC